MLNRGPATWREWRWGQMVIPALAERTTRASVGGMPPSRSLAPSWGFPPSPSGCGSAPPQAPADAGFGGGTPAGCRGRGSSPGWSMSTRQLKHTTVFHTLLSLYKVPGQFSKESGPTSQIVPIQPKMIGQFHKPVIRRFRTIRWCFRSVSATSHNFEARS